MNEPNVANSVGAIGCGFIFRAGRGGLAIGHAERRAHLEFRIHGFDGAEGLALGEIHNVGGTHRCGKIRARRSMHAAAIAQKSKNPRFVEDAPVGNAIAQGAGDDLTIIREPSNQVAVGPSPHIFQGLRQIPVIQGGKRPDIGFVERVGDAFVIVQSLWIGLAGTVCLNARPGNGEAITLDVEFLGDLDVFLVAVVGVTGNVAGVRALPLANRVRKAIPDGFALLVEVPGPFDLIGSRGHTPNKVLGKLIRNKNIVGFGKNAESAGRSMERADRRCTNQSAEEFPAVHAEHTRSHEPSMKLDNRFTNYDFTGCCWWNNTSKTIRMAPIVTAESATLKVGQGLKICQGRNFSQTCRKSVTAPWTMRSVTLPVAPASNSASPAALREFR